MTSRERVMAALEFREPDRVPIDLGGTLMSGIQALAYDRLKKHLGLPGPPRVYELYQMLAEVEEPVLDRLHCDVVPLDPLTGFFDIKRRDYKPWTLFDGTQVEVPGQFNPAVEERTGDWLLSPRGDQSQPPQARMPQDGFYFDMIGETQSDPNFKPPAPEEYAKGLTLPPDEELEYLRLRARHLRQETTRAVLFGWWEGGLGGVGGFTDWLMLLVTEPGYVNELFECQSRHAVEKLKLLAPVLGDNIDIIGVQGYDFGIQQGELFRPELFAELYVPHFKRINDWIHQHTSWKTFNHCCGSVHGLIESFIACGFDIFNPVQRSAANMEPERLQADFGGRTVFWGAGVDTQRTLPFGTPEEVAAEVAATIRTFAPGGGYVFNPVHNLQFGVPPENIVAAYDTAAEVGQYPIR